MTTLRVLDRELLPELPDPTLQTTAEQGVPSPSPGDVAPEPAEEGPSAKAIGMLVVGLVFVVGSLLMYRRRR